MCIIYFQICIRPSGSHSVTRDVISSSPMAKLYFHSAFIPKPVSLITYRRAKISKPKSFSFNIFCLFHPFLFWLLIPNRNLVKSCGIVRRKSDAIPPLKYILYSFFIIQFRIQLSPNIRAYFKQALKVCVGRVLFERKDKLTLSSSGISQWESKVVSYAQGCCF